MKARQTKSFFHRIKNRLSGDFSSISKPQYRVAKTFSTSAEKDCYLKKLDQLKSEISTMPLSPSEKTRWIALVEQDFLTDNGIVPEQKIALYRQGELSQHTAVCQTEKNDNGQTLTTLDFVKLQPFYNRYGFWLSNIVSDRVLLHPYCKHFPELYYHLLWRDGKRCALSIGSCKEKYKDDFADILSLLKEKKVLSLMPTYFTERKTIVLSWKNNTFLWDEQPVSPDELLRNLKGLRFEAVIAETLYPLPELMQLTGCQETYIEMIVISRYGENGVSAKITDGYFVAKSGVCADGTRQFDCISPINLKNGSFCAGFTGKTARSFSIPSWEEIKATVQSMAEYIAMFEIIQFRIVLTGTGPKVTRMSSAINIPPEVSWSKGLCSYLFCKQQQKTAAVKESQVAESKGEKTQPSSKQMVKQNHWNGFRPYMAMLWEKELEKDLADPKTNQAEKDWSHSRGFLSYRIKEMGLTEENWQDYVSDYAYFWVNRINNDYQHWIEDKLTTRFLLEPFKANFPDYYYCVSSLKGQQKIVGLQDLSKGRKSTFEAIFDLVREKGVLAVKKSYGTHGEGFYKFMWKNNAYYLNGEEIIQDDFIRLMTEHDSIFLITEYVTMHPWFAAMYPDALNTVRITCFNQLNRPLTIGGCFLKVGHAKGGFTDNINTAAGGIIVELDKTTGKIVKPEFKMNNWYFPCDKHPDTGVEIRGAIPHWEDIIKKITEITAKIPQIEYMGFDIAVTENSFKIIEINVFPDYTKYLVKDQDTQDFLKKKVAIKRKEKSIPEEQITWPDYSSH